MQPLSAFMDIRVGQLYTVHRVLMTCTREFVIASRIALLFVLLVIVLQSLLLAIRECGGWLSLLPGAEAGCRPLAVVGCGVG